MSYNRFSAAVLRLCPANQQSFLRCLKTNAHVRKVNFCTLECDSLIKRPTIISTDRKVHLSSSVRDKMSDQSRNSWILKGIATVQDRELCASHLVTKHHASPSCLKKMLDISCRQTSLNFTSSSVQNGFAFYTPSCPVCKIALAGNIKICQHDMCFHSFLEKMF